MEAKNPYRSNEFCHNWQSNLLATSMGDAYEAGKQAMAKEIIEFVNGNISMNYNTYQKWQAKCKEWLGEK